MWPQLAREIGYGWQLRRAGHIWSLRRRSPGMVQLGLRVSLITAIACGSVKNEGPGGGPPDMGGGKTVQVSTTGDDANDGITEPVKTLKHAIGLALADGEITSISLAS